MRNLWEGIVVLVAVIVAANAQNRIENTRLFEEVTQELKESYSQINVTMLGSLTEKIILPNGEDINDWIAPHNFPKKFVYYLAGYDEDDRPIWIGEFGKWDVRSELEKGRLKIFDMYIKQMAHNVIKSIHERCSQNDRIEEAYVVIDTENFDFNQVRHIPTVAYVLGVSREFQKIISTYLAECMIINANYAAEFMINLMKPVLGGVFERIVVYGNNKKLWMPKLLKKIPKKSVPEWYGGVPDFKPVKVYG